MILERKTPEIPSFISFLGTPFLSSLIWILLLILYFVSAINCNSEIIPQQPGLAMIRCDPQLFYLLNITEREPLSSTVQYGTRYQYGTYMLKETIFSSHCKDGEIYKNTKRRSKVMNKCRSSSKQKTCKRTFFVPKWHSRMTARCPFTGHNKVSPTYPRNGVAHIKSITYRAISIRGPLVQQFYAVL